MMMLTSLLLTRVIPAQALSPLTDNTRQILLSLTLARKGNATAEILNAHALANERQKSEQLAEQLMYSMRLDRLFFISHQAFSMSGN